MCHCTDIITTEVVMVIVYNVFVTLHMQKLA